MNPRDVQTLVLRAPQGTAVAHLLVSIPDGAGRAAAFELARLQPSFGPQAPYTCCSIGFSFAGLAAMGLPDSYLRVFQHLAPAFAEGAVQRSVHLGDSGASAAQRWQPGFRQDRAHVLLSWHGSLAQVRAAADTVAQTWKKKFGVWLPDPLEGQRLGAPQGEQGEWVHFGFRDGLSEVCIDGEQPRPTAPDPRPHAPGALLLGDINDAGFNPFALSPAPDKVRAFFHNSSFGVLRPMQQDLAAFEDQLDQWVADLAQADGTPVSRDFVKAKLCGRWPDGRQPRPGEHSPQGGLVLNLADDGAGEGCPFGSHVRRMRAAPDAHGQVFARPLQRRSLPFGPAAWSARPSDHQARGLLGHFFCASIEDQFEHLLGQWGARAPLGMPPDDSAQDPLMGPHDDPDAALAVPFKGKPTQWLHGFNAWTTTLGTLYAWHPGQQGLKALLEDDFVPEDTEGPWL